MSKVQFRYDGFMRWGCVLVLLLAACTKRNEAAFCAEGTCRDPNFPFCDVTGFVSGEEGTCIAVTCTPGEFGECRGDNEVRCNGAGTNYDVVQCERGCDAAADGCRLCNPNETACTNGKVATCDANGTVVSSTSCPLGCFEDQPRCREIDPSNGLAMYFDMVPNPPDLELEQLLFNTSTGAVTDQITNTPVIVPSFSLAAPANGAAFRVFVANKVSITRAAVTSDAYDGPAFVLLARSDVRVTGILEVQTPAGGVLFPGCVGGSGLIRSACSYSSSAGGGGAFATNGAKGGDVTNNSEPGGTGGIASGNEKLVPLRGGCAGGGVDYNGNLVFSEPNGGGAIQLVSRTKIEIDGILSAAGGGGTGDRYEQTSGIVQTGGGAGGAILLEAPMVELGANAQLLATGGDGSDACFLTDVICSPGGKGAKVGVAATAGADIACNGSGTKPTASGGGGGGLGRARINTATGTYTKASSAVEEAALTEGTIATR